MSVTQEDDVSYWLILVYLSYYWPMPVVLQYCWNSRLFRIKNFLGRSLTRSSLFFTLFRRKQFIIPKTVLLCTCFLFSIFKWGGRFLCNMKVLTLNLKSFTQSLDQSDLTFTSLISWWRFGRVLPPSPSVFPSHRPFLSFPSLLFLPPF